MACVALLALFLASSADAFHHHDSPSAATCPVCHVIHLPAIAGQMIPKLVAPVVIYRVPPHATKCLTSNPGMRHTAPRAPPA
jgi:hypothetical protein